MSETPVDQVGIRTLRAERDQLRKQVEKLLGAVDAHRDEWDESYKTEPLLAAVWDDDQKLYQAADQVRKELEG